MFMNGTQNRQTAVSLITQALRKAGVTVPDLNIEASIPKITRPTNVEFLHAIRKADAAGKDYATDKDVQALLTRQALCQVNLYDAAETARVDEQIQILKDGRDDLHAELVEKFDAAAVALTKHTATLTDRPLVQQAQDAMRSGRGGEASEAYAAYQTIQHVSEAWKALHCILNGTTLSGGTEGIYSISTPTRTQMLTISRDQYDVWELAHKGVRFTLAADRREVSERIASLEAAHRAAQVKQRDARAMKPEESSAMLSAFNLHADTHINKTEPAK